jgi:ketosteroid isomerase-like protein
MPNLGPYPSKDSNDKFRDVGEHKFEEQVLAVLRMPRGHPAGADARARLLEDEAEVRDLIMRYAHLQDLGQFDDLLALCTDDVQRVLSGTLDQVARGKEDLRAKLAEPVAVAGAHAVLAPADVRSRHLITDEVVRVAEDGARAMAVAQFAVVLTPGQGEFAHGQHEGTYLFEFRKEDGEWRFSRQVIDSNTARNPLMTVQPLG